MAGHNEAIGGGGFHHVAIRVHDFDGAIRFYTEALGFTERIRWGEGVKRACMLDTGDGNYLEVFAGAPAEPAPEGSIIHFALRTRDVDAAIERARSAGAEVTKEPTSLEIPAEPPQPVRLAFCKGPGGVVIEFMDARI